MKEYNLFIIKNNYVKQYKNRPLFLYDMLDSLFNLKNNFNYGINLYEQLCNKVSVEPLKYYLNDKFSIDGDDDFCINNVYIFLRPTRIVIKSDCNLPSIIKIFNLYSKNIFVCDFTNHEYFWLNNFIQTKVLSYI